MYVKSDICKVYDESMSSLRQNWVESVQSKTILIKDGLHAATFFFVPKWTWEIQWYVCYLWRPEQGAMATSFLSYINNQGTSPAVSQDGWERIASVGSFYIAFTQMSS